MARLIAPDKPCGMLGGEWVLPNDPRLWAEIERMEKMEAETAAARAEVSAMAQNARDKLQYGWVNGAQTVLLLFAIASALQACR